jgi:Kef-type K+ transport system membrane component KefB
MGEFLPLVAITVLLTGKSPLVGILTLLIFIAGAAWGFYTSVSKERPWLNRMVSATLNTSGQFAIRLVGLILAALVGLALLLGVDFPLGAFIAGLLQSPSASSYRSSSSPRGSRSRSPS